MRFFIRHIYRAGGALLLFSFLSFSLPLLPVAEAADVCSQSRWGIYVGQKGVSEKLIDAGRNGGSEAEFRELYPENRYPSPPYTVKCAPKQSVSNVDLKKECGLDIAKDWATQEATRLVKHGWDRLTGWVKGKAKEGLKAGVNFVTGGQGGEMAEEVGGDILGEEPQLVEEVNSTTVLWQSCIQALQDYAKEKSLATFKKRMLDSLVDETISWIQNGGRPRFIQNFGDTLKNAANAAVGDVVSELGFADLCSPLQIPPGLGSQLTLKPPHFSDQISCTLSDVVGNVKGFYNDFSQGGWKGYMELLRPQNNQLGLSLLIFDEIARATQEKKDAATLEAIASQGFEPVKECVLWRADSLDTGRTINRDITAEMAVNYDRSQYALVCTEEKITWPGKTVGAQLDTALEADFHLLSGTDDMSLYVNGIFDAAISRVVTEAQGKIADIRTSRSGRGLGPKSREGQIAEEEEKKKDTTLSSEEREGAQKKIDALTIQQTQADEYEAAKDFTEPLKASIMTGSADAIASLERLRAFIKQLEDDNKSLLVTLQGDGAKVEGLFACEKRVKGAATCSATEELQQSLQDITDLGPGPLSQLYKTHTDAAQGFIENIKEIQEKAKDSKSEGELTRLLSQLTSVGSEAGRLLQIYETWTKTLAARLKEAKKRLSECTINSPPYVCSTVLIDEVE